MTSWREVQHVETVALIDVPQTRLKRKPQMCEDVGPYIAPVGPKMLPGRPYKCTRPSRHDGNHQRATFRDGPTHEWTPTGAKVWSK